MSLLGKLFGAGTDFFTGNAGDFFSDAASIAGDLMPGTSSLVPGALSLIGGMQTNNTNKDIASNNNATSIELANTQYQRAVKDMQAAGINPMLAAKLGGNAVPPLQQAQVQNPMAPAVSSAVSTYSAVKAGAVADSQVGLNAANSVKALADTDVSKKMLDQIAAQIKDLLASAKYTAAKTFTERGKFENLYGTLRDAKGLPSSVPVGNGLTNYNVK